MKLVPACRVAQKTVFAKIKQNVTRPHIDTLKLLVITKQRLPVLRCYRLASAML